MQQQSQQNKHRPQENSGQEFKQQHGQTGYPTLSFQHEQNQVTQKFKLNIVTAPLSIK